MGACSSGGASLREIPKMVERSMEDAFQECITWYGKLEKQLSTRKAFHCIFESVECKTLSKNTKCESVLDLLTVQDREKMKTVTSDIWKNVIVRKILPQFEQLDKSDVDKAMQRARKSSNFDSRIEHKLLAICIQNIENKGGEASAHWNNHLISTDCSQMEILENL